MRYANRTHFLRTRAPKMIALATFTAIAGSTLTQAAPVGFRTVALSNTPIPDITGSTATAGGVVFGNGTSNAFSNVTTNSAGQVAFQSVLTGTGVTAANNNGIWSEGSGLLKMVQREDMAVPDSTGNQLGDLTYNHPVTTGPNLNANGATAYFAQMKGTGIDSAGGDANNTSLFTNVSGTTKMAVRFGDLAPGTIYSFQPTTAPPVQNASGKIAFSAVVTSIPASATYPSGTGANGIWTVNSAGTVNKVAALGDAAADTTGGLYYGTSSFGAPVMNASGSIAFAARLAAGGDVVTGSNDFGIWSDASGTMKLIARRGATANGTTGAQFTIASTSPALSINNAGTVAFVASLANGDVTTTNNMGIWRGNEQSSLTLVARKGSPAPGLTSGVIYSDFSTNLVLNKAGHVAVSASLAGTGILTSNDSAIYTETASGLSLVAQEGTLAPGGDYFLSLTSLSGVVLQSNAADHVAFRTTVAATPGGTSTATGLFAQNEQGALELVVKTGQLFEAAPGDFRTVSGVIYGSISSFSSGGEDGRISSWNDNHQIGFSLQFADGSSGVFVATVPEPSVAGLLLGIGMLVPRRRRK